MSRGSVVQVVRSDSFAGVERYIADTSTELHGRGWDVTVVGGDPLRMQAELAAGVRHVPARTALDVARALWAVGPVDVVHAHMTAAEVPAALMRRRNGGRFVITRHFAGARPRTFAARRAQALIHRRVDCVIAISHFVADSLSVPSEVVHNGVVPASGVAEERARTVVVVQRLEAEKDTATAVRAWAEAGLAGDGWRLVVYGRGSQLAELEALTVDLEVSGSVSFGGFCAEPRPELARAGLFLATAPAEPFGLAVVEAMAEGAPVLAARGGAHVETVGSEAPMFTPGDWRECARLLGSLAADPAARLTLGEQAQQRQRELFTVASHVDALEKVYLR